MLAVERFGFARIAATYYCYVQFAFTVFVCFRYNPTTHPTVSTYIRATRGIGLLDIPTTFPVLIIGSIRCKRIFLALLPTIETMLESDANGQDGRFKKVVETGACENLLG